VRVGRRIVQVLIVGALVLALGACGGDDDDGDAAPAPTTVDLGDTPLHWDAVPLAVLEGVAGTVAQAMPDQCQDFGEVSRREFVYSASKVKLPIPLALAECTMGEDETIELSQWPTAAERKEAVDERSEILCRQAKRAGFELLTGLHWTEGGPWAIQVDTEGLARRLATALDGRYRFTACPGAEPGTWEPDAVTRADELAATLAADPQVGCEAFQLLDKAQLLSDPNYRDGLPAAYGRCTARGQSALYIAVFSPESVARDTFVEYETENLCRSAPGIQAGQGEDWAVIANQLQVGARAAVTAGGTALPPAC
jgi:hypothetical protein